MTTIKAQVEIDIFNDPEFCESDESRCPKMDHSSESCRAFEDDDGDRCDLGQGEYWLIKCDQCKTVYLKAKKKEPINEIFIGQYRFDCFKGVYIDGKIIAELRCDEEDRLNFAEYFCNPGVQHSVSTHGGLFYHVGMIQVTGMFKGDAGKMCIDIIIEIVS